MAVYHVAPTWNVVFLPFFTLLALATAMGVSLWLSALYVLYRDVQYIIPFLVQIWMYVSFVMFPPNADPRQVALAVQPEPHDGRHRRLSLGAVRSSTRPPLGVLDLGRSWSWSSS